MAIDNTEVIDGIAYEEEKLILQLYDHWEFTDEIEVTGFKNKDNSIAVILFNKNDYNKEYNLCISDKVIHDNLDKHAIVSYLIEF